MPYFATVAQGQWLAIDFSLQNPPFASAGGAELLYLNGGGT